jgi:acyl-CoA thioester hydrolase
MTVSTSNLRVRYAETDQMGVVYYANYFVWFEIGRTDFLRHLGYDYATMEREEGCLLPVVEVTCRYKAPARYDDELMLETRLLHLRTSVVKFGYRLLRADTKLLLAEGETIHVTVDRKMQKIPLPERYVAPLRAAVQPSLQASAAVQSGITGKS